MERSPAVAPDWWAPGRPPEPPADRPMLAWAVVMMVLAAAGAVVALGYGVAEAISFEPTDGAQFRAWTTSGFRVAGAAGIAVCIATGVAALVTRTRRPKLAVGLCAAALALVAAMDLAAWGSYVSRSDPVPREKAIASSFPWPVAWGPGNEEVVRTSLPGAFDPSPPLVDRVVDVPAPYASVCPSVRGALRGWGTVLSALPFTPATGAGFVARSGQACVMTGRSPQGWGVLIKVETHPAAGAVGMPGTSSIPEGVTRVTVEIGPPGQ